MSAAGAFPVRSPLWRARPWVSDGVWCAHESLMLVSRLAALMPHNGLWQLTADGAVAVGDGPVPPIPTIVDQLADIAVPAMIPDPVIPLVDLPDDHDIGRDGWQLEDRPVEVIDETGGRWTVDGTILRSLANPGSSRLPADWRWGITQRDDTSACLVGRDRKDRPRLVLAVLEAVAPIERGGPR